MDGKDHSKVNARSARLRHTVGMRKVSLKVGAVCAPPLGAPQTYVNLLGRRRLKTVLTLNLGGHIF